MSDVRLSPVRHFDLLRSLSVFDPIIYSETKCPEFVEGQKADGLRHVRPMRITQLLLFYYFCGM